MAKASDILADPDYKQLTTPAARKQALAAAMNDPDIAALSDKSFDELVISLSPMPGMEKLGGAPPGPVPAPIPAALTQRKIPHTDVDLTRMNQRFSKLPGWDMIPDDTRVTPGKPSMFEIGPTNVGADVARFVASPFISAFTAPVAAPMQIYNWLQPGGHPLRGGFLGDDPIGDAYGNALAALAPAAAERASGSLPVRAAQAVLKKGPARDAFIKMIPKGKEYLDFRNKIFPEPPAPQAPDPFKPNPGTARKMGSGGIFQPDYGPSRPTGPTGWTAPTESLVPQPAAPAAAQPQGRFQVKSGLKQRLNRASGSLSTQSGMPTGGGRGGGRRGARWTPSQIPAPETGEPTGGAAAGPTLTPEMMDALARDAAAQRAGAPPTVPPGGRVANPGDVVITRPAGSATPASYASLQGQVASQLGEMYHKRDARTWGKLKESGMTKQAWQALSDEAKNAAIKAAGDNPYVDDKRTGRISRGLGGLRWLDAMFDERP